MGSFDIAILTFLIVGIHLAFSGWSIPVWDLESKGGFNYNEEPKFSFASGFSTIVGIGYALAWVNNVAMDTRLSNGEGFIILMLGFVLFGFARHYNEGQLYAILYSLTRNDTDQSIVFKGKEEQDTYRDILSSKCFVCLIFLIAIPAFYHTCYERIVLSMQ